MHPIVVDFARAKIVMRVMIVIFGALLSPIPGAADEAAWKDHMQAGVAAYQRGNYQGARPRLEAALKEAEQFGPDDLRLATSLNSLANLYREQNRYRDAEPLYQRALAIREKALGPEHPDVATSLYGLAYVYYLQGRYGEAEPLFLRALAIREKTLEPEHLDVASSLNSVGYLFLVQTRNAEAEPLLLRALAIREKALGSEHPDVATTLKNLADLNLWQGRYIEAELLYQRLLAIREKASKSPGAPSPNDLAHQDSAQTPYGEEEPPVVVLPTGVATKGDDLDDLIEQRRSGASIPELRVQAQAQPPKTEDKHELSIFYHKRGMANFRSGNNSGALNDLRLALENNQPNRPTPENWGNRYHIQNALANVYRSQGNRLSEMDVWTSVEDEYRQSDLFIYHYAQLRLMNLYSMFGKRAEAEKARKEAEVTLPRLPSTEDVEWGFSAVDQHNAYLAVLFEGQGNYQEAERRFRASLQAAENFVTEQQRMYGKDHRSLYANLPSAKRSLASILSTQGKYGEAEAYARASLQDYLARNDFNTIEVGGALSVVGWTRFQQGDLAGDEKYRRYALAAVEGAEVVRHSTALAGQRAALANSLLVQGRWNEALKLFEERHRGLRSNATQFMSTGSRHVGWAYVLHKTGQSQRAADMAGGMAAAASKRPVPNRWYVAQLRGVFGVTLAATGKTVDALKIYRESIPDLIRRDQDDATTENTGYWRVFWQRVILEGYLELLAKLQASGEGVADLDLVDESFRIADIARGSSVQEAITATAARAQLPDKSLTELARKEQDALNRIVALNRVLSGLARSTDERIATILTDRRGEIERLREEHATLRADIRKRYPEYAELVDPRPAGMSDVRKALAPGEALVSIYIGESESYVWTIGPGGKAAFRVVPLKRGEVEAEVRELRKALDFGEGNVTRLRPFDLGRAHKLYSAFFETDEALWKDAQLLNVIPHGALGQLPFALLVTEASAQSSSTRVAYRDVPWLVRKVAIAQLPSASAFAALRRTPAGKSQRQAFVGFGDPLFTADAGATIRRGTIRNLTVRDVVDATEAQLNAMAQGKGPQQAGAGLGMRTLLQAFSQLSSLPDTSDELREIATTLKADRTRDVFVGNRATEKNVKQARLENTRVIAFATHGIASGEIAGLDQPALVLANPTLTGDSDNDGFLTMEEVLGLKLDADWVVLSACNTASADGRGSEAVSGLGRAFFYAGARSLLVSNWAVETTSARLLTTELFRRQAMSPQMRRAEALRQSMLSLMGKSATGAATFSYAHPAFWAPFSLVGDGGR